MADHEVHLRDMRPCCSRPSCCCDCESRERAIARGVEALGRVGIDPLAVGEVVDAATPTIRAQALLEQFRLADHWRTMPSPWMVGKSPDWVEGFLSGLEHGYVVEVGG